MLKGKSGMQPFGNCSGEFIDGHRFADQGCRGFMERSVSGLGLYGSVLIKW
jgi:hypothetical protein